MLSIEEEIMGLTSHIVRGISDTLSTTPYHLTVTPYKLGNDALDPVRYIAETRSANGMIISKIEPDDARVKYLHKQGFPLAMHGRTKMGIENPVHDFDAEQDVRNSIICLREKKQKTNSTAWTCR